MIVCPYCDFENIEGSDECESCSQPLSDMHDEFDMRRNYMYDRISKIANITAVTAKGTQTSPHIGVSRNSLLRAS